jgi:hypothetical protein
MYPPKIIGLIGLPALAASIATWTFSGGAANAGFPCRSMAAPATEAFRSSRRLIDMLSLLESSLAFALPCHCGCNWRMSRASGNGNMFGKRFQCPLNLKFETQYIGLAGLAASDYTT